jgi:AbrB family looped-hinge helix DNA binding protein
MAEVTVSSKNQIVLPPEARRALGSKAGDKVQVVVMGDWVIALKKAEKSHPKALRGIGKGLYPPDYLQKERDSWD